MSEPTLTNPKNLLLMKVTLTQRNHRRLIGDSTYTTDRWGEDSHAHWFLELIAVFRSQRLTQLGTMPANRETGGYRSA